jgi:hypothetical protein
MPVYESCGIDLSAINVLSKYPKIMSPVQFEKSL